MAVSKYVFIESELQPPSGIVVSDVESTSVRVSWEAVENADRYTVTLSQTMGDDQLGLCHEDSHTVSVDTSSLSVVVGQTDDDKLNAFTTYSVIVKVVSDRQAWRSRYSEVMTFTTAQKSKAMANIVISSLIVTLFCCHLVTQVQQWLLIMSGQQL